MLGLTAEQIAPVAQDLADRLRNALGARGIEPLVIDGLSQAGGGSLPGVDLPTKLVALTLHSPHEVERKLRKSDPPIMVRISGGQLLIDPRTLWPEEIELVVSALQRAVV